jgi:serine/threonine protein kinase
MGEIGEVGGLSIVTPPQIDKYVFRGVIGEGAFAVVKLVQHLQTKEYFACKVIPRSCLDTADLLTRFEIEIRTHLKSQHPGVVRLFDLLRDETNYYVIMEFCQNGDLFQAIVDRHGFSEAEARPMVRQILDAVQALHAAGVSHRDLKPENVLLHRNGCLKLSDFGLAAYIQKNNLLNTPCGSPCYASPECISGRPYDGDATDMWSIGVIVYAILTGAMPWTERNQARLFRQITAGQYRIPSTISAEGASFIAGLLTVDPIKRMRIEEAIAHPWLEGVQVVYPASRGLSKVTASSVDKFFHADAEDVYISAEPAVKKVPSLPPGEFATVTKWIDPKFGVHNPKLPKILAAKHHRASFDGPAPNSPVRRLGKTPLRPCTSMVGRLPRPLVKPLVKMTVP